MIRTAGGLAREFFGGLVMKISIFILFATGLLGLIAVPNSAMAGDKEDAIASSCLTSPGGALAYFRYVGGRLFGQEIETCISQPSECYGPNNEFKRSFCAIGVGGCKQPERWDQLIQVVPFKGGCIAIYWGGMYRITDTENLKGGGNTVNAWDTADPRYKYVQAMVIHKGCMITSFSGGGIYKSCNGLNLGGGGKFVRLYQGVNVGLMFSCEEKTLRTMFVTGDCYMDPTGDNPASGPHCKPGDACTVPK